MKSVLIDLAGRRFSRLVVTHRAPNAPNETRASWVCRCDCGQTTTVGGKTLRAGAVKSCGCLRDETSRRIHTTHERCDTPEYRSWSAAKSRCTNQRQPSFANYGGRGITMAPDWLESFAAFFRDMGPRPPGSSLDRIDTNGPYAKDNCRWATRLQQANNARSNHLVTFNGSTRTIAEWERAFGFVAGTLKRRLLLGWSMDRAVHEPLRPNRFLTHLGHTHTIAQWARLLRIHPNTLRKRVALGWPTNEVLSA